MCWATTGRPREGTRDQSPTVSPPADPATCRAVALCPIQTRLRRCTLPDPVQIAQQRYSMSRSDQTNVRLKVGHLESHIRVERGQTVGLVGPKPIRSSLAPDGSSLGRHRFSHCSATLDASVTSRVHSSADATSLIFPHEASRSVRGHSRYAATRIPSRLRSSFSPPTAVALPLCRYPKNAQKPELPCALFASVLAIF